VKNSRFTELAVFSRRQPLLKEHQDAFGQEIFGYFSGKTTFEIVERDDGYIEASLTPAGYFAEFDLWSPAEREAARYACGRVLDIGCGAGRVGLYCQEKGLGYLGIDNSPLALEVCRQRGVENVSLTPVTQVSARLGPFDTIVMFGNNFGLFGSFQRARRLLKKFHLLTSRTARILAASNDIYQTDNPAHLAYHEVNRRRGRMSGQLRLRIRYKQYATPWFDYLMVSREEMRGILEGTGWQVARFIENPGNGAYVALIEKA
jgi:SAM-dependent methyltransferase